MSGSGFLTLGPDVIEPKFVNFSSARIKLETSIM